MSTFHENTKFLITKELFISVNVVNGKDILTLYNARRIPSTIHRHRTISVPCSPGIAIDYEQFIQLMEKATLITSIINSMKDNCNTEKIKSIIHKTSKQLPKIKKSSLINVCKSPRKCQLTTITTDVCVRDRDDISKLSGDTQRPTTLRIEKQSLFQMKKKEHRFYENWTGI